MRDVRGGGPGEQAQPVYLPGSINAQEQSIMVAPSHVSSFRGSRAKLQSHQASLRTVRAERAARKGQERKPKTGSGPDLQLEDSRLYQDHDFQLSAKEHRCETWCGPQGGPNSLFRGSLQGTLRQAAG